jgi:hypothetical protein
MLSRLWLSAPVGFETDGPFDANLEPVPALEKFGPAKRGCSTPICPLCEYQDVAQAQCWHPWRG